MVRHRVGSRAVQVIFSQSSELLERQSSMASSMEEVSTQQDLSGDSKLDDSVTTDQQFGVFKDFDFLEYELESQEVSPTLSACVLSFNLIIVNNALNS